MQVKDITSLIEKIAPLQYQEQYDNAGLIVGNSEMEVTGILLCLDSTESVVDEAIEMDCNLIIAHHPIVFKGLKKLNGKKISEVKQFYCRPIFLPSSKNQPWNPGRRRLPNPDN